MVELVVLGPHGESQSSRRIPSSCSSWLEENHYHQVKANKSHSATPEKRLGFYQSRSCRSQGGTACTKKLLTWESTSSGPKRSYDATSRGRHMKFGHFLLPSGPSRHRPSGSLNASQLEVQRIFTRPSCTSFMLILRWVLFFLFASKCYQLCAHELCANTHLCSASRIQFGKPSKQRPLKWQRQIQHFNAAGLAQRPEDQGTKSR